MDVIYEPKGAALEYSPLAVNLYDGCAFGCVYCYAPAIAKKKLGPWSANPRPRKNILKRLEADAKKIAGDKRSILLCFTCDPYQSGEASELTREALLILGKYGLTATVLTKGGLRACGDFDILKRNGWWFGTTVSYSNQLLREQWEPHAAPPWSRREAIVKAHSMGIETWLSMEPVMHADEALATIRLMNKYVDFWKVGKMNHRTLDIDWKKFHDDAVALLKRLGAKYYIKKELKAAAGVTE